MKVLNGTALRSVCLGVLFSSLVSCGGGFNCPIDPPSCCYNVLFGCGLFDLPGGCSCDDYGLGFRTGLVTRGAASNANAVPGLAGTWRGTLARQSTTCSYALPKVSGGIKINSRGDSLRLSVPGFGDLFGSRGKNVRANRAALQGMYRRGNCLADVRANLSTRRAGLSEARVKVTLACGRADVCRSLYSGVLQKQSKS